MGWQIYHLVDMNDNGIKNLKYTYFVYKWAAFQLQIYDIYTTRQPSTMI